MAAAISGVFPVCLDQQRSCIEDDEMKKKQAALMERLRSKRSSQHRSWTDSLMKSIRTTVVDRRLQADSSERSQVQTCLDTLQRAMKVISQQSLVERLELVARQQGLTFQSNSSDEPSVTLQADMFHIEIVLNKGGGVKEVKIAHQGDASVCHELTEILSRGDFSEFTSHLEGLQSIYRVAGEKKLKSKAFQALQSLENDLNHVAQFQNSISGVANYIHKSPLGILLPRTAGKPMKLIYFVSPYDLLDKKTLSAHPMTVEAITEHGLGRSVTVCLESGPSTRLQTLPLMSVNKIPDGNCLPLFNQLTHANSAQLPARFVLVLPQPVPVAMSILQKIQNYTELDIGKDKGSQPLLSLILDSNSDGKMKKDQQLFVSLPDQHHRYFISGVSGGLLDEPGVMLSRIPFSHPVHVPKILSLLRQQLLFNSVLASCVRPGAKKDPASSLVFEMTVISLTQMTVVFEHPAYDTMVTVDIDMSDITNLKCHMLCTAAEQSLCSDDYASRVLQRCLSLPILLRSLVRKGRSQLEKLMAEAKAAAEEQARRAQEAALWAATQVRQQQSRLPPSIPTKGRPPPPQPPPPHLTPTYPPTPSPVTSNPPSVGGLGDLRGIPGGVDLLGSSPPGYPGVGSAGDSQDKQNNPLLVNLLDNERAHTSPAGGAQQQQQQSQQQQGGVPVAESPMLSRLLEDNISVATNINPISAIPTGLQASQPKPKGTKGRKRRSQSDMPAGRSPKHRISESDPSERYGSIDLESSSSPFESSLGGSGGLSGFHHQMGPTPPRPPSQGHMSGVIDLTEENMPESSLKKLVDFSREGFMPPMEVKPGGATPDSELQALLSKQDHNSSPSAGLKPNQVTGSKNENASTSPEGLLIGSGEVGKASLPDPAAAHPKVHTPSRTSPPAATLAAFLGHGPAATKARRDCDVSVHQQQTGGPFPQQQDLNSLPHQLTNVSSISVGVSTPPATSIAPRPKVVSSSSMTEMLDVKPTPTPGKKVSGLKPAVSSDSVVDKRGLFEKFDFTGQTVSTAHVTISSSSVTSASSAMEGDDLTAPKVRLKLHPFRTPHNKSLSLDSGVVRSPSSAGSKSSNTFDFRSDEDDDEPMPMNYVATERLSVYSSSPTCLQISSKGKPPTPLSTPETPPSIKPEKYKRKDKGSGNAKRKKDRDDSKKERKKKKFDHDHYLPTGKEHLYRASTVESDQKCGTKLKIRVSKEPIKTPSPVKESSRMDLNSEKVGKFSEKVNDAFRRRAAPSSPMVEKLVLQKQDMRDHHAAGDEASRDRDVVQLYRSSLSASGKSSLKSGSSGKAGVVSSNSALSKADPKLAKATIRLKPLNMTSATSASVTLTPPVKTTSSGRSTSERSERRSQSSSTSTSVSTPTSGTLSLSSILPNAPTASSVASLPPIPKIPKVSSTASNTTTTSVTTSASVKSSSGVANHSVKNSTLNSGLNSPVNKVSGSPAMGQGGRTGSNPNTPNALKSPNIGFNKTGGPGAVHKTSPNVPGHKTAASGSMPPGILKNCGNNSQSSSSSQKTSVPGNQGLHKGPGGPNQLSSTYNRVPNSANQLGGPHKSTLSGQGGTKNMSNQGMGAHKGCGAQGNIARGPGGGNSGLQKGLSLSQGTLQKSASLQNQGGPTRMSGSPSHNSGSQKAGPQGKTASPTAGQHRTLPQAGNVPQKNSAQGSNFGSKHQGSGTSNSGGCQKLPGNQGRSVSTSGYSTSPNTTGRPAGSVRNNSVSGNGGGNRAPPNHLPVSRSTSTSGQKAGSGSSPRTSANQSPSNPSGPRFLGNSPQQKNSGASPSGVSQRSGSTSQASSQRNSNSSQTGVSQRSLSTPSQRQSSSPQTQRSAGNNLNSSPNQRPASNPGPAGDPRPPSSGTDHSPGYPVRPSSAGPRQSSSPSGPKQASNPGQVSTSSPSGSRTSSPAGSRTSSPGGHGQRGVGSGTGVSPLVSHQSSGGGAADAAPPSQQNSSGSLHPLAVSRQNSVVSSTANSVVSRQNSLTNLSTAVVSRPNSSISSAVSTSQQNLGTSGSTLSVSRLNSSGNLTSSSVSRQNSNSGGGGSNAVSRPSSNISCSTAGPLSASPQSASSVSLATSQARSTPSATPTSSKQLISGSTTSSTVVSVSRTSSAAIPGAQQTSSGNGVKNWGVSRSGGAGSGKAVVSKVGAGAAAAGLKTTVSGGNGCVVGKGAGASKTNTTTTGAACVKMTAAGMGRSTPSVGVVSSEAATIPVARSGAGLKSSVNAVGSSLGSSNAAGLKPPHTLSSAASTSSLSSSTTTLSSSSATSASSSVSSTGVSLSAAGGKAAVVGAARGRKGSLSAIVDKLATRMSASSGPGLESGECSGSAGGTLPGGNVPRVAEASLERQKSAADEGIDGELRAGVKRPASASGLSPPSGEHKVQRLASSTTPTASTTTATPSPAHTTPPHTSAAAALHSVMERQRSGSVGEKSGSLQFGDMGLDLSIPKDKGKPECTLTPLPPPGPDSRGRQSPKESNSSRSGSPAVGLDKMVSGTKFNGDSSKDKSHLENEVFKVPTPKAQSCEETDERGGGGSSSGGGKMVNTSPVCSVNSRHFPTLASPLSDASSPENELVIDCGEASSLANNRTASARVGVGTPVTPIHPSPKRVVELASEGVGPVGAGRTSPGSGSGKVSPSSGTRGVKNSPQQSSHSKCSPSLTSPSPAPNDAGANSPCEIDDDLMDAALMGFNAS